MRDYEFEAFDKEMCYAFCLWTPSIFIRELYRNEKIKGRRVANKFNYVLDNI